MTLRTARDMEVLVSEAPGNLSRGGGFASAGIAIAAADIVVKDYAVAKAVGTVDVTTATAITNGQKVKVTTGSIAPEYTAGAGATVADLIAFFEGIRPGLVSIVGGKLVATARGHDSIAVSGTASAGLFGTGLAGAPTKASTYRPVTVADTLDASVLATAVVAPMRSQPDGGGVLLIERLAEIKDEVARWPENSDAKAALVAALASRNIVAR